MTERSSANTGEGAGGRTLEGRVAVVTGATGVLGRTVAKRLAEAGARLVLAGRDEARLRDVAVDLGLADDGWLAVAGDLDAKGAAAIAQAAEATFGAADIVVHLVGGYSGGTTIAETDPAALEEMIDQHVRTTFHLARAFSRQLADDGSGRFVAVTSPFGFEPPGRNAAYAAAKAAQESLVLSLAQEFRGTGATANTILVRTIDTKRERITAPTTANARWTTPEEIAATILWLCRADAERVNGVALPLFGGPTPG